MEVEVLYSPVPDEWRKAQLSSLSDLILSTQPEAHEMFLLVVEVPTEVVVRLDRLLYFGSVVTVVPGHVVSRRRIGVARGS